MTTKRHHGSSLDNFLKDEGTFAETQVLAIKEVVVWQLTEAMEKQSLRKAQRDGELMEVDCNAKDQISDS